MKKRQAGNIDQVTICFPLREGEILLAMKKRGFGEGMWNGSGGKVEEGESVKENAKRETSEELKIDDQSLEKVAEITFIYPAVPGKGSWSAHIFLIRDWQGGTRRNRRNETPMVFFR